MISLLLPWRTMMSDLDRLKLPETGGDVTVLWLGSNSGGEVSFEVFPWWFEQELSEP
jgi:hypothetical protein